MIHDSAAKLKKHSNELYAIYKQRKIWLYTSIFIVICAIILLFEWDTLGSNDKKIWWIILSVSSSICVLWWWWTMRALVILVRSVYSEYDILNELTVDINEMRKLIKENIHYENTRNRKTRRKSRE